MGRKKDLSQYSELQLSRVSAKCRIPALLQGDGSLQVEAGDQIKLDPGYDASAIKGRFPNTFATQSWNITAKSDSAEKESRPLRIGCVLSGGQAAGGHNVIAGLFDYLKRLHPDSRLFGFLSGPKGIWTNKTVEITEELLAPYRNQGGFDIIGSGRDKIESPEEFAKSLEACRSLQLDGLVVIGGDDSNTNAAFLAEYFASQGANIAVIGVPKTIDGDLKNDMVEVSFGFDTACKVYSEMIGNIQSDAASSKKYYHFVRLMGRAASHITLECALRTHPTIAFIGEEVATRNQTLSDLTQQMADIVVARASRGIEFGVVLVPEGLIDFVPELHKLISELNDLLATDRKHEESEKKTEVRFEEKAKGKETSSSAAAPSPDVTLQSQSELAARLSDESRDVFYFLPALIREQLLEDRDAHGNVQLSKIETERLLTQTLQEELARRHREGRFPGKISCLSHFLGYEGRCAMPSLFDSEYCYALGLTAAVLVKNKCTGSMACVRGLTRPVEEWLPCGIPITSMFTLEKRAGSLKPVIKKALVDLNGPAFKQFAQHRVEWALKSSVLNPGPIQYEGTNAEDKSVLLQLETVIHRKEQEKNVRISASV